MIILLCYSLNTEFLAWRELFHYRANVLLVSKTLLLLYRYYYDYSSVSKIVLSRLAYLIPSLF